MVKLLPFKHVACMVLVQYWHAEHVRYKYKDLQNIKI